MKHNSPPKAPNLRVLMNRCWWEQRGVKVRVGWSKLR